MMANLRTCAGEDSATAAFVQLLAAQQSSADIFNPYAAAHAGGALRAARLACYLGLMRRGRPSLLLLGEAPGYRGGAMSGLPFTSMETLRLMPLLAPCAALAGGDPPGPQREATATMVWSTIASMPECAPPLLWNIFPWHPHRAGVRRSNRPPTAAEIRAGQDVLKRLLALIPVRHVAAVGQKAARALTALGVAHTLLRHPSHGGKRRFQAGFALLTAIGKEEAHGTAARSDA